MSAKFLIVPKHIQKNLLRFPFKVHERIIKSLDVIKTNPNSGIKLHGQLGDYFKFRVGDYRIVYSFDQKQRAVYILKIEHRQGVYK